MSASAWWLEVRRSPAALALPVLVALALLAALRSLLPGLSTWLNASTSVVASVQLLGPAAGGVAAYAAGRERRRNTRYLRLLGARPPVLASLLQCAGVMVWVEAVYLGLALILAIKTAAGGARPGFLSSGWLLVGALGLALHVVIGYVAGKGFPGRLAPPLLAVALFVLGAASLRSRGGWIRRLSPVTVESEDAFARHNDRLFLGQGVWYVGAGVLLLILLAVRSAPRRTIVTSLVVAGTVAATGAAAIRGTHGQFYAGPAAVTYTCSQTSPAVCVHPDYGKALAGLTPALDALVNRLNASGLHVGLMQQRGYGTGLLTPSATVFPLDDLSAGYVTAAQAAVVDAVTRPQGCYDEAAAIHNSPDYQSLVEGWLFSGPVRFQAPDAELMKAVAYFQGLDETARVQWLRRHLRHFHDCRLTVADFQ